MSDTKKEIKERNGLLKPFLIFICVDVSYQVMKDQSSFFAILSAVAVKATSELEFSAVSMES